MNIDSNAIYLSNNDMVYKVPHLSSKLTIAEILFQTQRSSQSSSYQAPPKEFFKVNTTVIPRIEFTSMFLSDVWPQLENYCLSSNCSHICIPIGQTYRCVCPESYALIDRTHCESIEQNSYSLPNNSLSQYQKITKEVKIEPNIQEKFDQVKDNNLVASNQSTNVLSFINLILIIAIIVAIGNGFYILQR